MLDPTVDDLAADLHDQASEEAPVELDLQGDRAAVHTAQCLGERGLLLGGELDGCAHLGDRAVPAGRRELGELLKAAGFDDDDTAAYTRYGSARTLYHFHADNTSAY